MCKVEIPGGGRKRKRPDRTGWESRVEAGRREMQ